MPLALLPFVGEKLHLLGLLLEHAAQKGTFLLEGMSLPLEHLAEELDLLNGHDVHQGRIRLPCILR